MKTLIKIFLWSLTLYGLINLSYERGYKKTTDKDYQIDLPETKPTLDTIDYQRFMIKRDTTGYKGKWIDVN